MMTIDIIGVAVFALAMALGVYGFFFGLSNSTKIEELSKRIEILEKKIRN